MRLVRFTSLFAALLLVSAAASAAAPIRIAVDATDAPRDVIHSHLTIPVAPGPMTLWYPKWIPGEHGPTGPIVQVAGFRISANGQTLPWSRDLTEMYEMHVDVPAGVSSIDVDFDFLDPVGTGMYSGGGSMTPQLAVISWNALLVYPAVKTSDDLTYEASLRLPAGWKYATALTTTSTDGNLIRFAPMTMTHLVDSPVLAGAHMRQMTLPASKSPFRHTINLAADGEDALQTPKDFAASYGRLVDETRALFGAEHYRHYDWLVTLSDSVEHFGLEHHESSDDRTSEDLLQDEAGRRSMAGLLAHEYVHSWNGKYRRPAGLATPSYEQPMTGELLWVYEGLTTYLGTVLPARSGLWTQEYYRDEIARIVSVYGNRAGRSWRSLEDTAIAAQILYGAPGEWQAYRRSVDFYDESVLLWLDVDMTIRRMTGNKRSLDDFCRRFHGGADGDPVVKPYTFDDVVAALNDVVANDWGTFLRQRIRSTTSAPLGGLETSGWRVVYNDTPNAAIEDEAKRNKSADYTNTLGFSVTESGRVRDVIPGSLAARAGMSPGSQLIAINSRRYTAEALKNAVRDSATATAPIQVIFEEGDFINTGSLDYRGGLRYPHLERIPSSPDWLSLQASPIAK